jgi:hypothetical protein
VSLVSRVVPQRNAALADLDEVLRSLLEEELAKVGMSGVTISFESPSRERTSSWPSPAINLFLYDLREAASPRDRSFHERPGGVSTVLARSPMRLACTFAITVWTREVRDEHQILSQLLSILLAYPSIPPERLPPSLQIGEPVVGLSTRVGQAKEDGRADFWTAIGSPYKVSLEYMVTLLCAAGIQLDRGERARRAAVSGVLGDDTGFPSEPLHPLAGRVVDAAGDGVPGAWVAVSDGGPWTTTGEDGRFYFYGLAEGERGIEVRADDGATASTSVTVPSPDPAPLLTLGSAG